MEWLNYKTISNKHNPILAFGTLCFHLNAAHIIRAGFFVVHIGHNAKVKRKKAKGKKVKGKSLGRTGWRGQQNQNPEDMNVLHKSLSGFEPLSEL